MPEDDLLQAIAAENNLSETAFLLPVTNGYHLRWFTPLLEMDLCGHATLASAHVLWQEGLVPAHDTIQFHTLSGILTARQQEGWIELNFPARGNEPAILPTPLQELFKDEYVNVAYVPYNRGCYIVELKSGDAVINFIPDEKLLKDDLCIITAAGSDTPYDFISRYFAGPHGVAEDPVTGSAHCSLAPYWAARLHKKEFFAYQASARTGELKVALQEDRVLLQGQAVTVINGIFTI
jgi:PhzF family phenazine biosynthesis protein